ncbi:HIT family protein [Nonomuraea sp. NBC_01738]|uniref:HIT family protein n=1 Tax=Nonomuraea sp. NBC_01738 TaxID=2976003 RepID=UPI002E0F74EC|nr:HIT family protein [Nonomuraea sp. NBC_01738]
MDTCIFCQIIAGQAPSHRVLEDEHAVAFLDISPASPGHTLVVPRVHARDLWELPEDTCADVARLAHRVAALLRERLEPDGLSVTQANGAAAWQEVFHFHTHLIPRWRGDALRTMWSPDRASFEDLRKMADRLAQR